VAPYEFTSLAMTQTNAKVTPFYALMTQVQNELPALEINRYIDNARHSGTLMNLSATQRNLLEDVKMVQYDIYSNQNYLGRSFYQKE
ncbi:MAG: phosphoglycerol transferase, partial [Lactococcus raffinolactis]